MKIKKGDVVKILAGKDSGKTGKVLRCFPDERKITVEKLNIMKKHSRPRKEGEKGQRIEIERKITISNAVLICSKCGKGTRVGYKISGENKSRICKKCGAEI